MFACRWPFFVQIFYACTYICQCIIVLMRSKVPSSLESFFCLTFYIIMAFSLPNPTYFHIFYSNWLLLQLLSSHLLLLSYSIQCWKIFLFSLSFIVNEMYICVFKWRQFFEAKTLLWNPKAVVGSQICLYISFIKWGMKIILRLSKNWLHKFTNRNSI